MVRCVFDVERQANCRPWRLPQRNGYGDSHESKRRAVDQNRIYEFARLIYESPANYRGTWTVNGPKDVLMEET